MKLLPAILFLGVGVSPAQSRPPTPLAVLMAEAQDNNPAIRASMHSSRAAGHLVRQAGALPDTQIMLQHLSVGSPRPFAGYTNSDFAYIGVGAAQELPGPGKRAARSQIAQHQADAVQAESEAVGRSVSEQVKTIYFKLAYLQSTLGILMDNDKLLGEIEQITESRYRVGKGNQQEVLKVQLQHTRILQEINLLHREQAQLQAQLKGLLGRTQDSPDLVTEALRERRLDATRENLLEITRHTNPAIGARELMTRKADMQVELAQREFRPDFSLQYMYQNTDRKFRDYYMVTFSVTLPNRSRRRAELAEALENREAARSQLAAEAQLRLAAVQEQYEVAQSSGEQLKIYREGLIPQAEATYRAALAAYEANRQDFETLVSSIRDVLDFQEQYQKALSEHEIALARLESLTGVIFP
jgi:outer membrane protein, heavy metal efflux system